MKVVTFPRDANPYQSLLHEALMGQGVSADFLAMPTRSQSLNLLLLPLTLLRSRLRGARILHLHWVFPFTLPGARQVPLLRLFAQVWFLLVLATCRLLRISIVWTAHNVLPHDRVFWDDRAARRSLLRSTAHVIVHDRATVVGLTNLLPAAALPATTVVPHGSYDRWYAGKELDRGIARAQLGLPLDATVLLFFGRVTIQKGVLELLDAYAALSAELGDATPILVVAGRCDGRELADRLTAAAADQHGRLRLDLRFLPDSALSLHLAATDLVVLPFREATTSGSAVLAMTAGRPAVLPDLDALANVPEQACHRYPAADPGALLAALAEVALLSKVQLAAMGLAGRTAMESVTWEDAAMRTAAVYRWVLGSAQPPSAVTRHRVTVAS